MTIKLGLIGLSEGNGHPYSWSAICNGYEPQKMNLCEFPVIPKYLAEQSWPDARITDVEVTHVWTQDIKLSRRIANASLIKCVVKTPTEMIGKIDGLLLARDDAENHLEFALPFLEAGIPVYIDKPIALSLDGLRALYQYQQYEGQIFTCSALRYAKELVLSGYDLERIGRIKHIHATTPNSWEKYSAHIIEPVLQIMGVWSHILSVSAKILVDDGRAVSIKFASGISVDFLAFGANVSSPMFIRVSGEYGWHDMFFVDSFHAFRSSLVQFIEGIRTKTCRSPFEFNQKVVSIIELGLLR